MSYKTVSIIIQARSTSKRFPGKIFEKIGSKQILQHVLDACYNSASYINTYTNKHGIICNVSLAIPADDPIIKQYSKHTITQGPEQDVLKRYAMAAEKLKSDYVVRITSDCPFVPPFIISKAINLAVNDNLDFLTNADPRYRTHPDGWDVEIISRKLLNWLDDTAKDEGSREHVTSYLQQELPPWATTGDIIGFIDLYNPPLLDRDTLLALFKKIIPDLGILVDAIPLDDLIGAINDEFIRPVTKYSIDTPADLKRMTEMYHSLYSKVKSAPRSYRL